MMRFRMTGTREMRARISDLQRRFPHAVGRALHTEAEIEMTEAKLRTPVDTGALRASGHVEPVQVTPGRISVEMAFGGPAAPYAPYVHDDLEAHHPVGQAKFLSSVLQEAAPFLLERIVTRAERELKT